MDAATFGQTKPERGHQLFRAFFIAPDLVILALALLVSTEVLRSILVIHKIDTNYGDSYMRWFTGLIFLFLAILVGCLILWYIHDDDERALAMRDASGVRRDRGGRKYSTIVWEIDWFESYRNPSFKYLLVFANAFSAACVVAYAWFVSYGFS